LKSREGFLLGRLPAGSQQKTWGVRLEQFEIQTSWNPVVGTLINSYPREDKTQIHRRVDDSSTYPHDKSVQRLPATASTRHSRYLLLLLLLLQYYYHLSMSEQRRPKRKAAEAAWNAIIKLRKQDLRSKEIEEREDSRMMQEDGFVSFQNDTIMLPPEMMTNLLEFLPKNDVVHRVSFVNKAWRTATRNPVLWPTMGDALWKIRGRGHIASVKGLLNVLQRPQFRSLKQLESPRRVRRTPNRSRTVFDRIAAACPLLQGLDLYGFGLQPFPEEITRLPRVFPHLKGVSLFLHTGVDRKQIHQFLRLMGSRLVKLDVLREAYQNPATDINGFSDETFDVLLKHCPNLETLRYRQLPCADENDRQISARTVVALFKGSRKLKAASLSLPEHVCDVVWDFCVSGNLRDGSCSLEACDLYHPCNQEDQDNTIEYNF
jgi:hypothetical protein